MHHVLNLLYAFETEQHIKDAITEGFNFLSQNPTLNYEYEIICTKRSGAESITPSNEITRGLFNAVANGRDLTLKELEHCTARIMTGAMLAYHLECGFRKPGTTPEGKMIIRPYIIGTSG